MKQTNAAASAPSPQPGDRTSRNKVGSTASQRSQFVTMAVDMSWRLALAVLIPVIIGAELDKAADTSPLLTLVGLVVALIGSGLVMRRTLRVANRLPVPKLTVAQKRAIQKQYEEDDD